MQIPSHLRDVVEDLQLRRWVYRSDFDRDAYFGTIDFFIDTLTRVHPDHEEPSNEKLIPVITAVIDEEDRLYTHVKECGKQTGDAADWLRKCTAAAWSVLQRYRLEVANGKWPE